MTIKQLNKLHPEKYVMCTKEFIVPVYIKPINGLSVKGISGTSNVKEAELWSYADTLSPHKLDYFKHATGYKNLEFVSLSSL